MGCVKIMKWRGSSCVTFWWSLLALTATGTVPCLNYSRWHSQSSDKFINTTDLLPSSNETLQQPRAAHRDSMSPSKALLVLTGHQLPAKSELQTAHREQGGMSFCLGNLLILLIHHFSDSVITCFCIKTMKPKWKSQSEGQCHHVLETSSSCWHWRGQQITECSLILTAPLPPVHSSRVPAHAHSPSVARCH